MSPKLWPAENTGPLAARTTPVASVAATSRSASVSSSITSSGERVALLGPIQGDRGDGAVGVDEQVLVVHRRSLAPDRVAGYVAAMSDPDVNTTQLTEAEMNALGDRLLAAIVAADEAAVRAVYAPDARIWHNFDQREQSVDQNVATLHDMHRRTTELQYTQIERFLSPGGFVQQHVLTGEAKGGPLLMPAIIRFWVEDGRITRLEEYVDTYQARVMYSR